jgi:phosphoserine phosphatase
LIPAHEIDVYLVDVCGTLVRDDTTLGLLRHHFAHTQKRPLRKIAFRLMTARGSPARLCFSALEHMTGKHILKRLVVKLLAGEPSEAFAQSAVRYCAYLLKERRVASVWRLIEQPGSRGRVLLASASLEPIVACLADKIGARYVASQLEQRGGVLTGRYADDLTGCKEQAVVEKYGADALAGRVCAISDNFSDRALLEKASSPYVVLHRKAHARRWRGVAAIFLRVDG